MIQNRTLTVQPPEAGARLDRFLVLQLSSTSRAFVVRAIEDGAVRVNDRIAPKGHLLQPNDVVHVLRITETADAVVLPNPALPLNVVYEDPFLVAVNKPAGIAVHPIRPFQTDTLANALVSRYPEAATIGDNPLFPAFVHRIDGDTSGIVLAARTPPVYADLRSQFQNHSVVKVYAALVHGRIRSDVTIDTFLFHDPIQPGRMRVARPGFRPRRHRRLFHAVSHVHPQRPVGPCTLVRVTIHTGVTHQIRCHLAHIRHPIVGDALYGISRPDAPPRHFLHAATLTIRHPSTGRLITLRTPIPDDLRLFIRSIGRPVE